MATIADMQAEIGLDVNPFISGTRLADSSFADLAGKLSSSASKMKQVLDGVFVDSAGKFRDASAKFVSNASVIEQAFQKLGVTSQAELNKAAREATNAFSIIANSGKASARDVEQAYAVMQSKIAAATGQVEVEIKKTSSAFQGLTAAGVAAGVAIGGMVSNLISHLTSLASSALHSGIGFDALKEQAQIAFTTMLGSGQKAKSFLDELAAFANKTPFEFPDLIKATQKFTAMGVSAEKVIPTLTAVGDAVAAMGGGREMIDRVSTALVQMNAKGKVSAEEMRQLAEAGIPAWDILAQKIGKSIPETMKLAEKGAIGAQVAIDALVQGMESRFSGMMEKQSHTFNGLMSTIKDTATQTLGSVLEPLFRSATGAMEAFVGVLPDVQAGIQGLDDQVKLASVSFIGLSVAAGAAATAIALTIGGPAALAVAGLGIEVAAVSAAIISNFGQISSAIAAWTGDVQINFSTIMRWIGMGADGFAIFARMIVQGVDVVGTVLRIMADAFKGVMGILQGFGTSIKGLITFDPTAVLTGVAQMQGAFTNFDTSVTTQVKAAMMRMQTNIQDTVGNLNGKYASGFQSFAGKVSESFTKASNKAAEYAKGLENLTGNANKHAEGIMGAKGAKKGKDETEKILKEQLAFVNDWVKATDFELSLSQTVWNKLPVGIRKTLLEASTAFHKSIDDAQAWGAALQASFIKLAGGDLGKSLIVKLKGSKVLIENPKIDIQSNVADVAKVIPHIQITAQMIIDAERFKKAQQRTLEDWLHIQVTAQDEAKDKALKADLAMREIIAVQAQKIGEIYKKASSDIKAYLGDGVGGVLIALADKFKWHLTKVRDWAGDVSAVIGNMPGRFGDMARGVYSTLNQWIQFANGVLAILSRLNDRIPSSVSKIADSLAGIFKGVSSGGGKFNTASVSADIADIMKLAGNTTQSGTKAIADAATKAAPKFNTAFGSMTGALATFAAGMAATAATGSKTAGIVSSLFSATMAGVQAGLAGGPVAGAIVGGVSLVAGIFGTLFGRKSSAQKAAEDKAKKEAALNLEKTAQDIANAALDGLKKGLEVLEGIADFANLPDKQFNQFFRAYEATIQRVILFAGTIKAESLNAAKAFGESVAPIADALNGTLQFFQNLPSAVIPTKARVDAFLTAMVGMIKTLNTQLAEAGVEGVKGASKWATRVKEIVGAMSSSAEAFNAIALGMTVSIERTKAFLASVRQTVALIVEAADWHDLYGVKAAAKYADRAKAMMELITATSAAFDAISKTGSVSADSLTGFLASLKSVVTQFVAMADTLPELAGSSSSAGLLKTIVDLFAPAVSGLNALPNYGRVAKEQMQLFIDDLMAVADLMATATRNVAPEMINGAAEFSTKMKPVVELFAPAVTGLSALKDAGRIGIDGAKLFVANLMTIADLMTTAAKDVSSEMIAKASEFASKMKPIVELIAPGMDAFKRLGEGSKSVAEDMVGFIKNVGVVASAVIGLNETFSADSIAGAARFADVAKRIFEFVGTAVSAFQSVTSLNWGVISGFSAIETALSQALTRFISLADSFPENKLAPVRDFLSTAQQITAAFASIGEIFIKYHPIGDSLSVVNSDLDLVASWMDATEARFAGWKSQAARMADYVREMIASLGGALSGLKGIAANVTIGVSATGAGASYVPKSSGQRLTREGGESSQGLTINIRVDGNLIHESRLEDTIRKAIESAKIRGYQPA